MNRILVIIGLCVVTVHADDKTEKLERIVNVVKALSDQHKSLSMHVPRQAVADSIVNMPARPSDIVGTWKKFIKIIDEPQQEILQVAVGPEFAKVSNLVAEQTTMLDVPVYRLNVLNQGNATGGAWTCGFHSLKNVLYVLQALQVNPMSVHIAQQLRQALSSRSVFEELFLNKGRLNAPGDRSWLKCAQSFQGFRQSDGIFPDDQRKLLHKMKLNKCLYPAFLVSGLEHYVFPIHSFDEQLMLADIIIIPEAFYHFCKNQWPSIAFTLPSAPHEQHFIGVVLHKTNTKVGLEIFLLDSLNRSLVHSKTNLQAIISWYNNLEDMLTTTLTDKEGFVYSLVKQYDIRKNAPAGMSYMRQEGLIATLSSIFDIVQAVIVGNKILGRNIMDHELSTALYRLLCFYYNALDDLGFNPNDPFFYNNLAGDWVRVADATHGILPATYGEWKPMLQSWADALGLPLLKNF